MVQLRAARACADLDVVLDDELLEDEADVLRLAAEAGLLDPVWLTGSPLAGSSERRTRAPTRRARAAALRRRHGTAQLAGAGGFAPSSHSALGAVARPEKEL